VAPASFLAGARSGSMGVGRLLVAPASFLAGVRSRSMGVGWLQVASASFLADVQSDRQARPREQRRPRLDGACRIAQHGTRQCPEPVGRSLHGRGHGRGSPLRCIGSRSAGAAARGGGEGRGNPWERPSGGRALCRRHERRRHLLRRRSGFGGERSPASAGSKSGSKPWSGSRSKSWPWSVTCSVARALPLPDSASNRERTAASEHGPADYDRRSTDDDRRSADDDRRSTDDDRRSADDDRRSTDDDHRSTDDDRRSTDDDHRPVASEHWNHLRLRAHSDPPG
jgi:hypothetical protein